MRNYARLLVIGAAATTLALHGGPALGQTDEGISVVIEADTTSVVLGEHLDLTITVVNFADGPTDPLALHLDITDPAQASSVDPEDWTSTLTKSVGVVESGGTMTATWTIQPISGGTFTVYAVALSPVSDTITVSNAVSVDVEDQRSLNPGGILPVALGAPAVIGALLLIQLRSSRRYGR